MRVTWQPTLEGMRHPVEVAPGMRIASKGTATFAPKYDHRVEIDVDASDGTARIDEIRIKRNLNAKEPTLGRRALQRIPVPAMLETAVELAAQAPGGMRSMDAAEPNRRRHVTDERLREVAGLVKDGTTVRDLGKRYGVTEGQVRRYLRSARDLGYLPPKVSK